MHTAKKVKNNYKKEKSRYRDRKTRNNNTDTTKTIPADQLLHKGHLQKGNSAVLS
jgi:hypothetical protein